LTHRVVLISHNIPHVFELADRIHVAWLGRCVAVLNPSEVRPSAPLSDLRAVAYGSGNEA
jgi:ABC-type sugar transport system ATPase subunit